MNRMMALEQPRWNDRLFQATLPALHTGRAVAAAVFGKSAAQLAAEARPLWRDYSYWNGMIDAAAAIACGVYGGFGRAGISWGYQDPTFANFWEQFGSYSLYRSSYHVIYTDQPAITQADNWFAMHPERDIIPRMIDMEVDRGDSVAAKANRMWEMSEIVLARDGVRPIIYSRRLLIESWLSPWTPDMLNAHKYMLAQYLLDPTLEHPGPPIIPERIDPANVLWHQSADTLPGCPSEVQNAAADRDRWTLGDGEQMHNTINNLWGTESPPNGGQMEQYVRELTDVGTAGQNTVIDTEPIPPGKKLNIQIMSLSSSNPVKAWIDFHFGSDMVKTMTSTIVDGNLHVPDMGISLYPGAFLRITFAKPPEGAQLTVRYVGELLTLPAI